MWEKFMKLKNKVLVVALAITMTTGPSLAKDFSNLSIKSNIAYASEDKSDKMIKVDQTEIERETHEYLIDHFKALQEDKEAYEKLTYHKDYTQALTKLEEDVLVKKDASEDEIGKEIDKKVKTDLINLIFSDEEGETVLKKLEEDKRNLESEDNKEANKIEIGKIDKLLNAMSIFEVEENTSEETKEAKLILSKDLDKQAYFTSDVYPYIEEKIKTEDDKDDLGSKNTLKNDIKSVLDKYKEIEKHENYKYLPQEHIDLLANAKAVYEKEDANKDELEAIKKSLDEKSPKIDEFLEKDPIELRKIVLKNKLNDLEKNVNDNKSKISEEEFNAFNTFIKGVKEGMEKEDVNKDILDQYIKEVDIKDNDLSEAIKKDSNNKVDKLQEYKEAIKEAEVFKNSPNYYRSSPNKKLAFDEALNELKVYISKVEKKESEFNKENADKLVGKLGQAKTNLNGFKYKELLEEAKKKLDINKNKLGDKYDALLKTYNELADENNKDYTVDRVRAFSDDIDAKLKSATLRPSTNNSSSKPSTSKPKNSGVQVSAKKLAVPRAQNGSRKSAKSLVRTGIDSIKIFGVVAVVAVVLLLLTKNKNKNGKNDSEK